MLSANVYNDFQQLRSNIQYKLESRKQLKEIRDYRRLLNFNLDNKETIDC